MYIKYSAISNGYNCLCLQKRSDLQWNNTLGTPGHWLIKIIIIKSIISHLPSFLFLLSIFLSLSFPPLSLYFYYKEGWCKEGWIKNSTKIVSHFSSFFSFFLFALLPTLVLYFSFLFFSILLLLFALFKILLSLMSCLLFHFSFFLSLSLFDSLLLYYWLLLALLPRDRSMERVSRL